MEAWVQIAETNNRYSVSNNGMVKKNKEVITRSNGRQQILNEKILTPISNKYGYLKVRCSVQRNKVKNIYIHVLVANYFINKNKEGLQVNHINGVKTDNRVENLEWVTCKENINHSWKIGLSSPTNMQAVVANGISFASIKELAKYLNVNRITAANALKKGYYISNKNPIIFKGTHYSSIKEAFRKNNISVHTIKKQAVFLSNEKIIIQKEYAKA